MRSIRLSSVIIVALILTVNCGVDSHGSLALAADECQGHGGHGAHNDEPAGISVSRASQELISVKTTKAKLSPFVSKVSVVGQVAQDAEHTVNVSAPSSGTIAECRAQIGSVVDKGDVLCIVNPNGSKAPVEVRSPIKGVVIGGSAKTGEKVDSISSLHMIADFSVLQATFDVYEKDIRHVKCGQEICVQSVAYPDKCFDGKIVFISPRVDSQTNSIKVRADICNPDFLLKLGMFVTAAIAVESEEKYVVVPIEALHQSGGEKTVFIKTGAEEFESRAVVVDEEAGGLAAICEGVKEGEEVVTENGFLLKSELLKSKMGDGCAE